MRIGALHGGEGKCEFRVWAPTQKSVELLLPEQKKRRTPLERDGRGYWSVVLSDVPAGTLYQYILDRESAYPDPASHLQPGGVHRPSSVVDHHAFGWGDAGWEGVALSEMVIYELHVGTFSDAGTFHGVIPRLRDLKSLGVNAIEIMPVGQFPGDRNWGYDGVYPYAVQDSYGGPDGLKTLVNACHTQGMSVILDVVYNHLGPEGNYLSQYAPYFTDRYRTPWGPAVNFDGPHSDEVRDFFLQNALFWLREYHIDALRVDAIHAIYDLSPVPFLHDLTAAVHEFSARDGRQRFVVAESDLGNAAVIRPRDEGGIGFDAQWSDDYHHCIHTLLTGEKDGYYADFGTVDQLAKCMREGYAFTGEFSTFRKRRHGNATTGRSPSQFVVCAQNHDQVGNRMRGERLTRLVSFEAQKLAAGSVLLGPFLPLLFMGEEYAEDSPFLFFTSHSDDQLIEAVRRGRIEEFSSFAWGGEPPDPQSEETFRASTLRWEKRLKGHHASMLRFYSRLLELRRSIPALATVERDDTQVSSSETPGVVTMRRSAGRQESVVAWNFMGRETGWTFPSWEGLWERIIDSSEKEWGGPGTLLPPSAVPGTVVRLRGHSVSVFLRR
ncbi:MAG: malto-oligosyltrehalose trehalohydrolase [Bacteroidota bacterium]